MPSKLQVLQNVHDELDGQQACEGYLIGYADSDTIIVTGCIHQPAATDSQQDKNTTLESLLPKPLQVIGTFAATMPSILPPSILVAATTTSPPRYYATMQKNQQSPLTPTIIPSFDDAFHLLRCTIDVPLVCPTVINGTSSINDKNASLPSSIARIRSLLTDSSTVFLVSTQQQFNRQTKSSSSSSIVTVVADQHTKVSSLSSPLLFRPFINTAVINNNNNGSNQAPLAAPTIDICGDIRSMLTISLHLDIVYYLPKSASPSLADVAQKCIVPSLLAQLDHAQEQLFEGDKDHRRHGATLPVPRLRALHFRPLSFAHHVTLLYPVSWPSKEIEEKALASKRKYVHAVLGLPTDRPLLRVANAVDPGNFLSSSAPAAAPLSFSQPNQQRAGGGRLQTVHQGLPSPGIKNASRHTVRGDYDYFHYMQDKFDDSGWGCAYRSLQTICSWFQRQHYTARAPPSHREIQTALVSMGDKTQDFIGSKQWIGAIELGFILDALLGVECKVITMSSGADMPSKAREIAAHFDSQGTPIMIGGGVLAYTLLGIEYNADTGECAFLILDPHYTGTDDIGKIHSGQWVAWKRLGDKAAAGGELFVKDAFYNLLCPQRPQSV